VFELAVFELAVFKLAVFEFAVFEFVFVLIKAGGIAYIHSSSLW
jgi:hypothetical protein